MHRFQFSKPEHNMLVRRVAAALLDGTLRPKDIDGLTDRQVQAQLARHAGTTANASISTSPTPA